MLSLLSNFFHSKEELSDACVKALKRVHAIYRLAVVAHAENLFYGTPEGKVDGREFESSKAKTTAIMLKVDESESEPEEDIDDFDIAMAMATKALKRQDEEYAKKYGKKATEEDEDDSDTGEI